MPDPLRSSEVTPEKVQWLWRERIPRGMISVVAGRPDQGKGLFAAHVTAESSKAGVNVLYSAAEDSDSLMTRPRLEAAGADLDRVLLWRFQLPMQFHELAEHVIEKNIGLIVMDPFASHLGGGISRHSDNVRIVTDPLAELLDKTGCACLIVEHALKRIPMNGHPMQAIGGSGSGLPAAARAAYVFGVDPLDEDKRVLAMAKLNIRDAPKAIFFEVDTVDIATVGEVPVLNYDSEQTFDPMRLFDNKSQGASKVGRPPDKRAAAAEWLAEFIAKNGPTQSGKIMEAAKKDGMAVKTLRRAAEDMAIVKNPPGGGRFCTWDLPDELKDLMGMPSATPPPGYEDDALIGPFMESGAFLSCDDVTIDWEAGLADLMGGGTDAG